MWGRDLLGRGEFHRSGAGEELNYILYMYENVKEQI